MEFKDPKNYMNENTKYVELKMEWSDEVVKIAIFEDEAPETAINFLGLVDKGFYNGLIFHRIIQGFMVQGGDPTGTGMGGSNANIKGEFLANGVNNFLSHKKGVISMARSMDFDSASSQFFIMHRDNSQLDGQYAAFGHVVEGFDVIERLAGVDTSAMDRPSVDQVIEYIKVV